MAGADTPSLAQSPTQLRLTATGLSFTGADGSPWVAGQFSGGSIVTDDTAGPTDIGPGAPLFEHARVGVDRLRTTLSDGTYAVTLYFVEPQAKQPGERVFDVAVNGTPVITDLDLAKDAGLGQPTAKTVQTTVEDGELTVDFTASVGVPVVSGVEVHPATDKGDSGTDSDAGTPPVAQTPAPPTEPAPPTQSGECATATPTAPPGQQSEDAGAPQPGADQTAGIPDDVTLTTHPGDLVVKQPGTVVESMDITGRLEIDANDVVVRNTLVRGGGHPDWALEIPPGVTGVLVESSEVGGGIDGRTQTGASAGILLGNNDSPNGVATNVVRGVEIHHTVDGIRLDGNATVENSWIHGLSFAPGVHSDGIQSTGWAHMLVRGNTIEGGTNDAVFFKTETGNPSISCVTVENNTLVGVADQATGAVSSYGLGVAGGVDLISATGNTFVGPFQVAPASSGVDWQEWADNVVEGATGTLAPN